MINFPFLALTSTGSFTSILVILSLPENNFSFQIFFLFSNFYLQQAIIIVNTTNIIKVKNTAKIMINHINHNHQSMKWPSEQATCSAVRPPESAASNWILLREILFVPPIHIFGICDIMITIITIIGAEGNDNSSCSRSTWPPWVGMYTFSKATWPVRKWMYGSECVKVKIWNWPHHLHHDQEKIADYNHLKGPFAIRMSDTDMAVFVIWQKK